VRAVRVHQQLPQRIRVGSGLFGSGTYVLQAASPKNVKCGLRLSSCRHPPGSSGHRPCPQLARLSMHCPHALRCRKSRPTIKRFCHAASTPARRLQRAAAALPDPARATGSHSFSPLTAPTPCAHRPTINKRERDFEGDSALWAGKSERAAPARRQSMPPRSRCSAGAAARVAPVQDDAQRDGAQAAIGGHRRLQEALRAAAPQWSRRRSGHDLGAGARRRTRPVCGCAAPHAAERR